MNGPWGPVSYLPPNATYSTSNLARLLTQLERQGTTGELVTALRNFDERIVDVYNGLDMMDVTQTTVNVTIQLDSRRRMGLPLGVIGQGTQRLFEMLLLLPLAADGIALIDEVEQGVYHGNLPKAWNVIQSINSNGVRPQVFATTHSWECVTAAVEVFRGDPDAFRMFRISRIDDELRAIPYEHEVALAATTNRYEVR